MNSPLGPQESALTPKLAAPQHKPRPLPLFLDLLGRETRGDPVRLRRALAGLRRYQEARRPSLPDAAPAVAEAEGAVLRDYGGDGAAVVFVPSLINPPSILDLSRDRSLLRWLAGQGFRPLLVDWGWPSERRRTRSIADHVERVLIPLIAAAGPGPVLVGYCLGGTMALAAAARMEAAAVACIAAPWRFSGFGEEERARLAALWERAEPAARALGVLPMEVLQTAFWSLDPARTVAKFEAFAEMEEASEEYRTFVTLEDWANDGPPLPEAAARELFEGFFRDDRPGRGEWLGVDPAELRCPLLNIVSTTDRIVPAASAAAGERIELAQGHVGMVVGSRAREALWAPLARWLSRTAAGC